MTNKKLKLSMKEIKGLTPLTLTFFPFSDSIDNKNGNLVTSGTYKLIVWKKEKKSKNFTKYLAINFGDGYLSNINEDLFCFYKYPS